jgi:cell division inhibitor SulA
MFLSKSLKINHLNNSTFNNKTLNSWVNVQAADNKQQMYNLYNDIFQQHYDKNKWILMINPEDEMLESLGKGNKVDVSNVLRVNTQSQKMKIKHIKNALIKGNCSAIVLAKDYFNKEEIAELTDYAEQGKTRCVIIKNKEKNKNGVTNVVMTKTQTMAPQLQSVRSLH